MEKKPLPVEFIEFIQCLNSNDVFVISREDLIKNKKASGRSMDIADAEKLALCKKSTQ